jgi:hypothetical protein
LGPPGRARSGRAPKRQGMGRLRSPHRCRPEAGQTLHGPGRE